MQAMPSPLRLVCILLLLLFAAGTLTTDAHSFISFLGTRLGRAGSRSFSIPRTLLLGMVSSDVAKPWQATGSNSSSSNLAIAQSQPQATPKADITVVVSTSLGTPYLDKRKKLVLPATSVVADLKRLLSDKFPGQPPVELQHLYFNTRLLADTESINSITVLNPVPLFLDMITGTNGYDRVYSIAQAMEAYSASIVQQAFLASKLHDLVSTPIPTVVATPNIGGEHSPQHQQNEGRGSEEKQAIESGSHRAAEKPIARPMESVQYAALPRLTNTSLCSKYQAEIRSAMQLEWGGELHAADTAPWRGAPEGSEVTLGLAPSTGRVSPLQRALAIQFDLNSSRFVNLIFYTVLLLGFSIVGGTNGLLLSTIPLLWLSKLRQVRHLYKMVRNVVVGASVKHDFLYPTLSAPLRVLGKELASKYRGRESFFHQYGRKYEPDGSEYYRIDDDYDYAAMAVGKAYQEALERRIAQRSLKYFTDEDAVGGGRGGDHSNIEGAVSRSRKPVHEQDDYDAYEHV